MREAREMIGAVGLEREEMLNLRNRSALTPESREHLAARSCRGMCFDVGKEHWTHAPTLRAGRGAVQHVLPLLQATLGLVGPNARPDDGRHQPKAEATRDRGAGHIALVASNEHS